MSATAASTAPFQNTVQTISVVNSFHPSAQQKQAAYMNVELDVEKRLQAVVAKDRVRIKEFFIDFDKLRKGQVGVAPFRTCLGTLNFKFSEGEIQQLLQKYTEQNGLVNYAAFCGNVDHVFSDQCDPAAVIDNSKSTANFSEQEKTTMVNMLEAIRLEIKNRRILIKPQFQDYDRTNCQHITTEQFRRVLKELRLIPPSEELFQLILRKYLDKGNIREINYRDFCADIDQPRDMFVQYSAKHPEPEVNQLNGTLRNAGSTYYFKDTTNLDVINNRFMEKRVNIGNSPSDIEDRLRAQVVMKRVRIEEFFFDFDKLRRGKVTKTQFESILSMLNFNFTKEEFDQMAEKYRTNDPEFLINYKAFCHSINSAFTTYGIQKDPLAPVLPVTVDNTTLARRKYLQMTQDECDCINKILGEYRSAVVIKRIHLKPMFQDFDITKNQHVTKHQFLRTLGQLGVTTDEKTLNVLLKAYMDKGNVDEVNYFDFCNDIDSPEQLFGVGRGYNHSFDYYPKQKPRITGIDIKKDMPNDVEDVLAKLRKICCERRVRISEFFRDFDKLRSGYITEPQFRIGLNMGRIVLSGTEFKSLTDFFQAPKEGAHIKWREFSDSVDQVFTKKGLEKSVDIVLDDARTQSFYGKKDPSSNDGDLVVALQERFKSLIVRERLDAKSFFQDQDRHNHFKCSPKQFKQTVTLLGVSIDDADTQAVVNVYGNKLGDIEYLRFLSDCDVLRYVINEAYTGAKSTYRNTNIDFTGSRSIDPLMQKIREHVMRNRIRIGEFFQDHDPLRKGVIDATKFRVTLYQQKLQLTTEEYEKLENYFRDPQMPTKIRYFEFNEEIERIFTEKDLEKNPTKTIPSFTAQPSLNSESGLTAQEEGELRDFMVRLGTDVKHRRLLIKPFFQDKDRSNSGFVTNTRFRSIFDNQKLWITDREYYLINKRFQAAAANEINYVAFDSEMRLYSGDRE